MTRQVNPCPGSVVERLRPPDSVMVSRHSAGDPLCKALWGCGRYDPKVQPNFSRPLMWRFLTSRPANVFVAPSCRFGRAPCRPDPAPLLGRPVSDFGASGPRTGRMRRVKPAHGSPSLPGLLPSGRRRGAPCRTVCHWSPTCPARPAAGALKVVDALPVPVNAIQVDGRSEFMASFERACRKREVVL